VFSCAAPRSRFTRREETAADTCCRGLYAAKTGADGAARDRRACYNSRPFLRPGPHGI